MIPDDRNSSLLFAGGTSPRRVLLLLLSVHVMLLGWGAYVHSPTIDEVEWLPGGWASWKTGRFDIVSRNPPHVGLFAAVPLLFANVNEECLESPGSARSIGRAFIRDNGYRSFWLFTLGRWVCIPFSVLGAIVCFSWGRELYGDKSGILAAVLWCFCPNILAHGQLVAHDVPATSLGLVAHFAFWRWLRHASILNFLLAGIGLGAALLTKMTTLTFLFLWPVVWFGWRVTDARDRRSVRTWSTQGAMLAAIFFVALDVLNLGYGFQGSLEPLDSYTFRSYALTGAPNAPGNRFVDSAIGEFPVPFPRDYVLGVDRQRAALEGNSGSRGSYLRGKWTTGGSPYFYLYALAIKVPLGTWCLVLLSLVFRIGSWDSGGKWRDEAVLLAPAAAVLLAASISAGFADHLRYILPCFPFVFIWISRVAILSWSTHRWASAVATAAATWSVVSSLWVFPHSLSYFNETVGGPRNGHYHLVSSNVDYGQDLLKLNQWYDSHPEARPLGLAYWDFDSVDPRTAGIDYYTPPSGPKPGETAKDVELGPTPGWYAVNVNMLHGDEWPGRSSYPEQGFYGYFLNFTPVARAGYSILIYHVTLAEANRVRAELGLPSIESKGKRNG